MDANIGVKIKKIRELKGFTQEYLASSLGFTQGNYSKIESGSVKINDIQLTEIANILEVSKETIENFDDRLVFNNNGEIETANQVFNLNNHYVIDPKLEALYDKQIQLLEKQIAILEKKLKKYEQ